jgi:MFS family permease
MVGPAIVGLFAGVLVDRWNRKWIMILSDVARGILVALIPWLMGINIRFVYIDLFLVSCASAFFRPAGLAVIPQSVSKSDLMPANSFLTTMDTGTEIIGPVLAGIVVQRMGYETAMYVDAASYFASAVLLAFLSLAPLAAREAGQLAGRIMSDIKEGFRYIRTDRLQLGLLTILFLGWWVSGLNSLQTPLAMGEVRLTNEQFGWFNGVWGVGFVISSLLLGWYGSRIPKGRLITGGFLGWIVATAAAGLSVNAGMLYAAIFWVGFANIVLYVSLSTTLMEVTPSNVLGRVLATRQVAAAGIRVAAVLVFGALADFVGVRQAVLGMAGLSLAGIAVGFLLFPEIGRVGAQPDERTLAPSAGSGVRRAYRAVVYTLVEATDAAYETRPQQTLNAAVLVVVGVAWLALLFSNRWPALYIAAVVAAAVAFRLVRGWWLTTRGSKNVRYSTPTGAERRLAEGRRSPVVTGPTAK